MLTITRCCLLVAALCGPAVQRVYSMALPQDPAQTWFLRHSSQVAQPVLVNSRPVSDEFPIPRFQLPAQRRQDGPTAGNNNLQGEEPIQVKPGDKVSLVVRGRNPLEPQQFVDVTSLLAELQKGPPASDGAYHVFLAPPNYPSPSDGQKFDVTYVGAPPAQPGQQNNNAIHPPFFVAPLDYSVPHGYGRIQIPTRQVKFALGAPGGPTQFQQAPQQQQTPPQLRQQPQPQFLPVPPGPPAASFQQQQPQIQPPRPQFQSAFPPAPTPFQPVQQQLQPQFQSASPPPPAPTPFQQQPQIQPFLPNQALPPPPSPPTPSAPFQSSSFDESLSGGRIQQQSGFIAPTQTLEEAPARPVLVEVVQPPRPQEPLVLAVDKPEFLQFEQPRQQQPFVPLVIQDGPAPIFGVERPQTPVLVQVDPVQPQEPRVIVPESPVQIVPTAVLQQEEIQIVAQSTEPAATAPPTTTTEEVKLTTTEAAPKKKPNIRLPEGAQPQWPDFQSVRRQQLNRQQNNRQKSNSAASADTTVNSFTSASAQRRPSSGSRATAAASADGDFTFGQKIRPKVKTNALVSPPEPISDAPATVAVQRPRKPTAAPVTTAAPVIAAVIEKDPPVSEGDETFETLESQNAASNRGRIRFNRPEASDANSIPAAEVTTTAAPIVSAGRGRFRTTTSAPAIISSTTEEQPEEEKESTSTTETPSETRGIEEQEINEEEKQQVKADSLLTTTTETAAEEEEEEQQQEEVNEEEQEVVSQAPVQVTTTAAVATAPVRNEKPWSPYEAIQRQRQSAETEKRNNQPETSTGNQPIRIRGKTTFASSRPTSGPVVRQEVNRPVVLRPSPPANRQPSSVQIVRPSRPIQPAVRVRDQQDFVAPVAPEFGIRGDQQQAKPILIVNQEPTQSLVPVGRRVPEVRPPGQFVRIVGRPSNAVVPVTKAPTTTTEVPTEVGEEEEEEEELEENENENEHEEEEEEEEEEVVEEEQTAGGVGSSTTSTEAPVEVVAPSTTEAAQEVDDQSVNSTTGASTTSEPSEELESAVESASGNNLDERQVLGVSTATEVSLMYELCYRGRCVRVHE